MSRPGAASLLARSSFRVVARAAAMIVGIVAIAATAACSGGPAEPPPDDGSPLTVPLRVHFLASASSEALDTTIDEAALDTLLARVNGVWTQAAITFVVDTVLREEARNPAEFERLLRDEVILGAVIPPDHLHPDGWDVFVIRDLRGVAGGIYYQSVPAVLWPELTPEGVRDLPGDSGRILAHEIGHMLGLAHVTCTAGGNLMAPECPSADPALLAPSQAGRARGQVLLGRAFGL